jgi:hypothetical protein
VSAWVRRCLLSLSAVQYTFAGSPKMSHKLSSNRPIRRGPYIPDEGSGKFGSTTEASINQRMNAIKGGDLSRVKVRLGSVRRQPMVPADSDA